MNEINNYKYLLSLKIYKDLNLSEMEIKLEEQSVRSLEVQDDETYKKFSNYFFLVNDVNINKLNESQKDQFYKLFSRDLKTLKESELKEMYDFIEETYQLIIFPDVKDDYVYYGPVNNLYICPKDAIALGLVYDCFSEGEDFEVENKINDVINTIQFDLAKKINKKVAVIPYNQITLNYRNNGMAKR